MTFPAVYARKGAMNPFFMISQKGEKLRHAGSFEGAWWLILLTALLSLAAVLSASFSAEAAEPPKNETFTFRLLGDPATFDWNLAHTPIENYLMINLMEGLVMLNEKLEVVPALAESWKKSKDGSVYSFKLRKDAKWSDGVPVKAKDFVFSWKRVLTAGTGASYAYFLFDVKNAEAFYKGKVKDFSQVGVKAVNDHTLQVTLEKPVAHWKYIPSFWITFPLREDIFKKYGNQWATAGKMVTAGPYVLDSHSIDSKVVLKRNPHYHGKVESVSEVVGLIVKDDSTAVKLFEAGKLDYMTDIPSMELIRLQGKPELKSFPYLKTGYIGLVLPKSPMDQPKVRQAIAMAIDKTQFSGLLFGNQKPAGSFVPPGMLAHSDKIGLPFDPARAKKLLKEAGNDGKPLTLGMVIPNWERPLTLAQYLQAELKKNLGVQVTAQPYDHKTFRSQLTLMTHPMFILSWGADYPDPDNFLSMWLSDSGNNRVGYKSAKYDELILKARTLQDEAKRKKLYLEAQKLLLEKDAAIVPMYYDNNVALIQPYVKNLKLNPINYFYFKEIRIER